MTAAGVRGGFHESKDGSNLMGEDDAAEVKGISPRRATLVVALIGVVITLAVSWTAWTLNKNNEHRLLVVQTKQAAAILSSTILNVENPLETALGVESATDANPQLFAQFASSNVGPGQTFTSATLWKADGISWIPAQTVGAKPLLDPSSHQVQALINKAIHSPTFVVTLVRAGNSERVVYVVANPKDPRVVLYAERAIPAEPRSAR